MKKIYLMITTVMAVCLMSCDPTESPIYDGTGQALVYFPSTSSTLEVLINDSSTIDLEVGMSTTSNMDRQVGISVDMDASSAVAAQYSVPTTVTIPAGEYFGTFTVTGIDVGLDASGETLVLNVTSAGLDNTNASTEQHTVRLVEICPVDPTFAVGDYRLDFVSGGIAAAGFAPAMGNGTIVTLVPGAASTERVFNVKFYPTFGFANPPVDFSLSLSCAELISNGIIDPGVSGVGCGGVSIPFGAGSTPGSYNTADDSVMTMTMAEDVDGFSCGAEQLTTYTMTKL